MAHPINGLVDKIETTVSEIEVALDEVGQGRHYRRANVQELHGQFARAMERVNTAFDALAQSQSSAVRNRLMIDPVRLNSSKLLRKLKRSQHDLLTVWWESRTSPGRMPARRGSKRPPLDWTSVADEHLVEGE